ncbi:MAG: glycosyltransferase family 4 protein [Candidatus Kapaibacterium sp.]
MKRPIRVAYVSHFDHYRMGGQQSMLALIENLDRERFIPMVICPGPGELSERLKALDCPAYFVELGPIKPKHIYKFFKNISAIKRILKYDKIDIIHPDHERDALVCGLAQRNLQAKMVWHLRLTRPNNLDKINSSFADKIIGISEGTRRRVPENQSDKFVKIYNGVDCDKFRPTDRTGIRQKLGLPPTRFIITFVGQITPGKGVFDLLSAAKIMKGRLEDDRLPLMLFIGTERDEETMQLFCDRIRSFGIGDVVRHIPQQTNIHEWMQASEALTLPSHEGVEGMGRVIFEAMATGATAVGTDISGVREAISQETGFLVPEQSPDRLATAFMKLINDPALLDSMQHSARRRACETFDIKKHAREVERVYLNLIQ